MVTQCIQNKCDIGGASSRTVSDDAGRVCGASYEYSLPGQQKDYTAVLRANGGGLLKYVL
jgi:hypothetical protein